GIAVHEWGDETAPPLFCVHGGFDFARTYSAFAPRLAAGGYRGIAWDQRGHGGRHHAERYSREADTRHRAAGIHPGARDAAPVRGHSKGGGLMMQLADAMPHRISHLVNLDGLPSKRPVPDVANHERTRMLAAELEGWLDHRRGAAFASRKPGTLDELAARR